jgi:glycosyltransferase involved in cell wall biosynthesis
VKVALVCDWYRPRIGGLELHLQDLARELSKRGHDVVVITSTPGSDRVEGLPVRRIDAPRLPGLDLLYTAEGVRRVARAIAAEKPDVVHAHVSIVSPVAFAAAIAAQRQHLPSVVTFHSIIPRTRTFARGVGALLGAGNWHARYTAVSQCVAGAVQAFAPAHSFSVLPNAVDVEAWRSDTAHQSTNELRLVTVMRLNAKKRPLALVAMMRRLAAMRPSASLARLRIIGDGPRRLRLERAIGRAGLEASVELLGYCSRDRIRQVFADSDVFVLPAVRESFGIAALEARSAGLPIVAMRASGVAEFVEHGRSGLLAHNDAEFAAHVALLARDRDLLHTMATHNQQTPPPYDWTTIVAAHVAIYCEAIALRANVRADSNA